MSTQVNLGRISGPAGADRVPQGTILRPVAAPSLRWPRGGVALFKAAVRELLRDRMALFWIIGSPIAFLVLFGTVFGGSSTPSLRIGVAAADGSVVARRLTHEFGAVSGIKVSQGTREDLLTAMRRGDLDGVVVLPRELDAALEGGRAGMTLIYDPAHANTAGMMQSLTADVADHVDRQITGHKQLLSMRTEPLDGRVLGNFDYVLPGLLAMALIQLGLFGTALPLVQLRQAGVLRQLGTTPLRRWVLAASQIALRLVLSVLLVALMVGLSRVAYGLEMVGNWFILLTVVILGSLVMIALGYLLAARLRNAESGNGVLTAAFMPLMFLSGLFFPLEAAPSWMRTASTFVPSTYLGDALRQVMVGATPRFTLAIDLAVLAACLGVLAIGAVRVFRWE